MVRFPNGVQVLIDLLDPQDHYYLVGGAIRDALLSRSSNDLDIVCSGDARLIARKFAQKTSSPFFMLDESRNACRVITTSADGSRLLYDFTEIQGGTIIDDLNSRDFTINAMAVDLADPSNIIDPQKGGRDLVEKFLRPCSSASFLNDPLRVLRAIRYSIKYDLKIEPATVELIKAAISGLANVSNERKRDELFKILANHKSWVAFELIWLLRIQKWVGLPDFSDPQKVISNLRKYSSFCSYLMSGSLSNEADALVISSFINGVKPFRQFLCQRLQEVNQADRDKKSLNGLTLFLIDANEQEFSRATKNLALSNEELNHLILLKEHRNSFINLVKDSPQIDCRAIYHYFQALGPQGIDLALISLARTAGCVSAEIDEDSWLKMVSLFQRLLDDWINYPNKINPRSFLSGKDLMFEFDLTQGPLIGKLIEGLREEQACGEILDRESALEWVENKLNQEPFGRD